MDRWTAAVAIAHLRLRLEIVCRFPHLLDGLNHSTASGALPMAGEIREKMAALRKARETMLAGIAAEIDGVIGEVKDTHADGLEAMKLPRAELAATRQEIREIRAEFAPISNGGPPGPLPGTEGNSASPSPASATPADKTPVEPAASWKAG